MQGTLYIDDQDHNSGRIYKYITVWYTRMQKVDKALMISKYHAYILG